MPKTILVVDDDPVIRDLIGVILRGDGYCVHSVGDGSEALDYIERAATPSLILLDLMMPRMDGCEFLSLREASPYLLSIPVIVISAVNELARGFFIQGTLTKPFSIVDLRAAVQKIEGVSTCRYGATCVTHRNVQTGIQSAYYRRVSA